MAGMTERLEKMLTGGRDDAMLRFGLGSAYFNEGEFEQAVQHLERCIEQNPDYAAAYKMLGKAYFKLDDMDNAARVLDAGLPIAKAAGDKQTEKEILAFLKKAAKQAGGTGNE